jgi:murein DD-endopeptidase MepM/ murein hydrolase activator NlpD
MEIFVAIPRSRSWILSFTLALASALGPACAEEDALDPVRLEIRVDARMIAPGEPLRINVGSNYALESLNATLLGETVFMTAADEVGLRWSGWSMIGLDQDPLTASLELRGTARDGREAIGTWAVIVAAKEFPEENLTVSAKFVEPPPEAQKRIARERAKLARIYRHREAYSPPTEPFVRPVSGIKTSIFGMRRLFNGKPRSPHPGLDLRASEGTPVRASGPGRVVLAEDLYYSGNVVIIDHGGGLFTLYAHLSEIKTAADTLARSGDLIGLSGSTGRVTGPHLHWGAKIGNRPFDPEALLEEALF